MNEYAAQRKEVLDKADDTVKELFARKSVRVFEDREISAEDKRTILYATSEAPTAGCQQLYTVLDITDKSVKERLSVTCDNQPFIAEAPMVLVFCADCRKWYDAFQAADCEPRKPGAGDLMLAVIDSAVAAQNAVTAAWSMGIGSCYIGDILENCEEQREILKLPEYVVPAVTVVFGYPTRQQLDRPKPERIDLKYMVSENAYPERSADDYRDMFRRRCGYQSYEEWMGAFCERKFNSGFSREMTRSVKKFLEDF